MRRGRSRERRASAQGAVEQLPFGQVRNPYAPMAVISDDEVEAIHHASLRVLRDNGMEFQLPRAVEILRGAGATVGEDGKRVRFDPAFVEEKLTTVPARFTLHGRARHRDLEFGGSTAIWGTVGSAPNVSDRERGRISGNFEDYKNLVRLSQALNAVHTLAGYPVEPTDLEVRTRHLHAVSAAVRLTDKPQFGYAIGGPRMADAIEIVRIARGVSREELRQQPSIHTVVNSNSPLIYDGGLLEGAIVMAELNQPVIYTPFTLAGAMAPVSVAGALVLQNAEALAGIAFSQCVNPGAPTVYGSFTSNVDMKSGAPAFGTPEYAKATVASGQLARRYNFPWRSSSATASNAADAQAAYEAQMSLWPVVLSHANFINHGFGWLEGGLCASYEKFILDAEMVQMMQEFLKPLATDEAELGLDAIAEVGPGGHFFGCAHTMARYETAFYRPMLSDWRNFENWRDAGAVETSDRATRIWKQLLADYQEPALDPAIGEELDAFVARRIEEGGVPERFPAAILTHRHACVWTPPCVDVPIGLVPGIHVLCLCGTNNAWMAGTSPAMTSWGRRARIETSEAGQ